MASFRGIRIEDNIIERDDTVTEEVWFEESTLREVTAIGDFCFSLGTETDQLLYRGGDGSIRSEHHHAPECPTVLDLSLLEKCEKIGDAFAMDHYGPVLLPPALITAGCDFMARVKCRVLHLPETLESIGVSSFRGATVDQIIMPPLITTLPDECFNEVQISQLEIPGSVERIGREFCADATIGTLTFAGSTSDQQESIFQSTFLDNAIVQTLEFKRDLRLVSNGSWDIAASATITLLRHTLPTRLWDPLTVGDKPLKAKIRATFLGNSHNANLFPYSIITIDEKAAPSIDPTRSSPTRTASSPPSESDADSSAEVDLATLEVFEDKHRSLVQDGDTIDMRGLVKCRELREECFAGLTGVSTLWLPPNLSVIHRKFMQGADLPHLDIEFPQSLTEVRDYAFAQATVRSVNFVGCDDLTILRTFLIQATITSFTFPPKIEKIRWFMRGINAPHLDLKFPKTVCAFDGSILQNANLRSVDFSCCDGTASTFLDTLLSGATVETIVFPPTLESIGAGFMEGAKCPRLDLVFPALLSNTPALRKATVRSVDFSACQNIQQFDEGHLQQATFKSYVFPPNVISIGKSFMSGAVAPNLDLVIPSSVKAVMDDVLSRANVRSVNFHNCGDIEAVGLKFLQEAAVASVSLPPNLRLVERSGLSGIRGEDLVITFPESLQDIQNDVLSFANVKHIDMSAAKSVSRIPKGFCNQATVTGSFKLPPTVASLGTGAFSAFKCAQFRFDGSPSLELIGANVLRGAKISTVTITDSPKLETVGDNFLSGAQLETPASLVFTGRLKSVGKSFCSGTTLQRLDMHLCERLLTLPDAFLFGTSCVRTGTSAGNEAEGIIEEIVSLPPTVNTYGDYCFASSKGIANIGAAANEFALSVGHSFGAESEIEKIPWTGRWVAVGHSFCKDVKALEIIDAVCFHSVGDDFCRGVGKLTVDFSLTTLGTVGMGFLQEATFSPDTTAVDLRGCTFTECPERFMYQARFERRGKVTLPSTVASIGAQCCAEVIQLEDVLVVSSASTASPPLVIQDDFLCSCVSLASVSLPATVASFGDRCLQGCPALTVSLSLPMVNRIGHDFCADQESLAECSVAPFGSKTPALQQDVSSSLATTLSRAKVSLHNVSPDVQIGDNFLAHADCSALDFKTIGRSDGVTRFAVDNDKLIADIDTVLNSHGVCGTVCPSMSNDTVVLKELSALRKAIVSKMASATSTFRSITEELSVLAGKEWTGPTNRVEILRKELQLEEGVFFRHRTTHQYEWAREALRRHDYSGLLAVLKEMDQLVNKGLQCDLASKRKKEEAVTATSSESSKATVGRGTVDDLPEIPDDVPAWFGFDVKVSPDDAGLSLLHWAVKYSRQFPHLLSEVSWSLRDLTLVTEQGFTALHYAVLYDIEAAALSTLLSIAAKAEIHRTWSDARSAGGVRVSPLHLAYLYRRDGIVKELLAFEWDPTEAIKPAGGPNDAEGTLFDAFDQSIVELGQARGAAALQGTEDDQIDDSVTVPTPVQLFHASVLVCVRDALESGISYGRDTEESLHHAFVTLRHQVSADFPLLSPNKWAEARAQQLALAAWGSGEPNVNNEGSTKGLQNFLQEAFAAALSDPVHGPNVRLQHRQVLSTTGSLRTFVSSRVSNLPDIPTYTFIAEMSDRVQAKFLRICRSKPSYAAPRITAETLLLRTRSMEEGPHRDKVEDKLAVVIPFRFVIPVLPFFYLTLVMVFGLSWFFHPPILEPTLMGIENAIADCTNPYNTKDATEDGVIPWDCSVGFTELGMQVETFGKQAKAEAAPRMASFFSFIEKDKIPRNVTHLPWAYLRFATVVTYNGLKTKAGSVTDAETTPEDTAQEYWVLTELRKLPDWAPEIFEQKNTKANESTISFKGETTRTFAHTVVPFQFGNHTLLGAWMAGVAALLIACVVAFAYHGYAFSRIVAEREVRLVEITAVQRSLRSALLACEFAAVLFIAVGLAIMATTLDQHKADDLISRSTAAQWQRAEIFFRVGLTFCSFRAVSFFSEMPKPHHFATVNSGVVAVGLLAALVSLLLLPTSRVGLAASLKSLLSIQAVDALTLPVVLDVSLYLRSSKVTDEVRQAHYDSLREDLGDEEADSEEAAAPPGLVRLTVVPTDCLSRQESVVERGVVENGGPSHTAVSCNPTFAVSEHSAANGSAVRTREGDEGYTEVQPFTTVNGDGQSRCPSPDGTAKAHGAPPNADDDAAPPAECNDKGQQGSGVARERQPPLVAEDRSASVRSRARRRWALSWAVILVAGLGQVLLYGLAVTVVVRPLLTLPAPGGVLPVTGDSFLSSDDLGMHSLEFCSVDPCE